MKIDNWQKRELLGLLFWGFIGLVVMILVISLAGCATPMNTDRNTHVDYSQDLQQMQSRMDSLMYNMQMQRKEVSEKLSNLKIENRTVYYSQPDSTGKQYPTQVIETIVNQKDKENKTSDTELNVTIQQLVTEVSDLRQKLDAVMSEKNKVVELSWWDLNKNKVYVSAALLLFLFILIVNLKRRVI